MEYRTLGKTGLRVSALGIGTWQLSGPVAIDGKPDGFSDVSRDAAIRIIRQCAELGYNLIDTAAIYGDGEGERRVGEAIGGHRADWIVVTKFGMARGDAGQRVRKTHSAAIREGLDASLRRLRTDYVDVYLYHGAPDADTIEDGVDTLERLRQSGKIRFGGISVNDASVVRRLARCAPIQVLLYVHSMLTRQDDLLRLVSANRLGGVVRGVMAGGRLSGRYFRQAPQFNSDDIRSVQSDGSDYARYREFEQLVPAGRSMAALALRYALDSDATHSALIGSRQVDDYRDAVLAFDLPPLEPAVHRRIAQLRRQLDPTRQSRYASLPGARFLKRRAARHPAFDEAHRAAALLTESRRSGRAQSRRSRPAKT